MAFGAQTVSRLIAALGGLVPSATIALLLGALLGGGPAVAGATLSFMGLAIGGLVGLALGRWLDGRLTNEADRLLPVILTLVVLPLAVLPAQPAAVTFCHLGFHGWIPVFAGVVMGLPLGIASGCALALMSGLSLPRKRSGLVWCLAGAGLGVLLAFGAAQVFSAIKGAFLVNLFTAPMAWPTLPRRGDRSLLLRMLLTLVVFLSSMFLLFL
ncbi:MAG TPA: hypothetical protein VM425_22160 [Myxococcota bacterium]|nr:hypothetical protein [Myxococcota bacterium]